MGDNKRVSSVDSPFTIRYECEDCNYLELWRSEKPGDYTKWLSKCAGCRRPFREGWINSHPHKKDEK